jgi:hypothetical protein
VLVKVCSDFGVLALFCCLGSYVSVCGFNRDIRAMDAFFVVYEVWLFVLSLTVTSLRAR